MNDSFPSLLASGLLRGAALILVAHLVLALLRHCTSALRHQVCAWALLLAGLVPFLSPGLPGWKVVPRLAAAPAQEARLAPRVAPPPPQAGTMPREAPARSSQAASPAQEPNSGPASTRFAENGTAAMAAEASQAIATIPSVRPHTASEAAAGWTWPTWLASFWALGFAFCALVLAFQMWRMRRLVRAAQEWPPHLPLPENGLPSGLRVKLAEGDEGPLVFGTWRPVLLLPRDAIGWPAERLRVVLAHEAAHVRRQDCAIHLAAGLATALHWCNPLAWLLLRRLQHEAERACDDAALGTLPDAPGYAAHLLAVAAGGRSQPSLVPSMARPSGLRQRVAAVLDPRLPRRPLSRLARCAAALIALACGLPLALAQLAEPSPAAKPPTPPTAATPVAANSATTPAAAPTPIITIQVTAVDQAGKPVPKTRLQLINVGKRGRVTPFKPDLVSETDAQGLATVTLPPGYYLVTATQNGLVATGQPNDQSIFWDVDRKKLKMEERLVLVPAVEVVLDVQGPSGQPVPNARAVLENGLTGNSNAQGRITLGHVPPGEHTVKICAPPLADRHVSFNTQGKKRVELKALLEPGFELRGTVRDAQGRPIKNARVRDHYSGSYVHVYMNRSITDAEGRYQIGWYPKSKPVWSVGVEHADYAKLSRGDLPAPDKGTITTYDFVMDTGKKITGIVKDESGRPIANASLRYGSTPSWVHVAHARSNAEGAFTLAKISVDRRDVVVAEAKGRAPAWLPATPGQKDPLAFTLKPGLVVKGRILDRQGKPVVGARLSPRLMLRGNFEYVGEGAQTDKDGAFELHDIAAQDVAVDVYGTHITAVRKHVYDPAKPLVITVDPIGVLKGRVVDAETGKPITAYNLRLDSPDERAPEGEPFGSYSSYLGVRGQDCQAEDGSFLVDDLTTRAHYKIHFTAPGYVKVVVPKVLCRPADDAAWPLIVKMSRGQARVGKVTDAATGKPVEGAALYLHTNTQAISSLSLRMLSEYKDYRDYGDLDMTRSGPDGSFTFHTSLPPTAPVTLIVRKEGYAPLFIPATQGEALDVALQPGASIRLDTRTLTTVPAASLNVPVFQNGPIQYDVTKVASDGILNASNLAGGKTALRLDTEQGTLLGVILDLQPGKLHELDPARLNTRPLKVRLLLDGAPVEGQVYVNAARGEGGPNPLSLGFCKTSLLGTATFPALEPTNLTLHVMLSQRAKLSPYGDPTSKTVDLATLAADAEVVFQLVTAP